MALNSKQKGARAERQWAELCRQHGYEEVRRTAQFCGKSGEAADCIGLPYIYQEVKHVEKLNLREAMRQAIRDCKAEDKGNIPIVASKKNGRPWLVTMTAENWFELYEGYLFMQQAIGGRFKGDVDNGTIMD